MSTPTEQLFKFVSLRPPAAASATSAQESCIRAPTAPAPGSLVAQVVAAKDSAEAETLAAALLAKPPEVMDFQGHPQHAGLRALRAGIAHGALRAGATVGDIEKLLGAPVAAVVSQQVYPALFAAFLDVYAAGCVALDARPNLREDALLSLRTLHLVDLVKADEGVLASARRLSRVLAARVVLPAGFLRKNAADAGGSASSQARAGAASAPPSAPGFTPDNLSQLASLHGAKRELEAARRRSVEAPSPPPPDAAPPATAQGQGSLAVSGSGAVRSSRLLSPAVVETLTAPTLDLLAKEGFSRDRLDAASALRIVGDRIRDLGKTVFQGVPLATMLAVDRALGPGHVFSTGGFFSGGGISSSSTIGISSTTGVGSVKPLGIGDLLIVEQTLQSYEAGEISYVENVLKTESFKRTYRTVDKTEQTIFTSTTTTETKQQDLQTTDRYELSTQAQKTIAQDQAAQAGVTVSASYGPVSIGASASYATTTATSDATSSSLDFAKDVTDRSVSTITTEVKQSRKTKIVSEVDTSAEHGFNNTAGTGNVVGIYQWLDKKYLAQIYSYGQRLMFEFLVPEPAAFYLYAQQHQSMAGVTLSPPEPLGDLQPSDLHEHNYHRYVRRYAVANAPLPPPEQTVVTTAFDQSGFTKNTQITKSSTSLQVPAGYQAKSARFGVVYHYDTSTSTSLTLLIGSASHPASDAGVDHPLDQEDTAVPIALIAAVECLIVTVEVTCVRSDAAYQAWQEKAYDAIVAAYNAQKAAYDSQVKSAGFMANSSSYGGSEDVNRRVEEEELKKGCLTLLGRQYFEAFGAMHLTGTASDYPEFDVDAAMSEGSYVQFFEQAFEWDEMTYLFYPYFWMDKKNWGDRCLLQSSDATFAQFLRAGYARVLVPVTPAYDDAVLYFLSSGGKIWNGGDAPTIDDPLYVSIVDEIVGPTDRVAVGDPWTVTLPTTLVYLKADATLPDWTSTASPS